MASPSRSSRRLWAAANSLRGPVDPADFKAYIFPLLFYKRVSDTWDDEHARGRRRLRGDDLDARDRGRLPPLPGPRRLPLGRPAQGPRERRRRAPEDPRPHPAGQPRHPRRHLRRRRSGATRRSCPSTRCSTSSRRSTRSTCSPIAGRPRRARQRLRVPAQAVRRRVGQEGGRVLHPALGRPAARPASSTPSRPTPSTTRPAARAACSSRRPTRSSRPAARSPRCASTARRSTSPPPPSPA